MRRIGKYKIEDYISKGASGKVYKASADGLLFAIKEMPEPTSDRARHRLQN